MEEKHLHIISFNIPYPPDYGGTIDVFYKLKALSECSVKITLHCFEYNRPQSRELERYCEKVYYYKRFTGLARQFTFLPYIVYSRKNNNLLSNLLSDGSPIFFEGIHTTYYLTHPLLEERIKMVRSHNIEHDYYHGLARNSRFGLQKLYYELEAWRLKRYEQRLMCADYIFPLSIQDSMYFKRRFGEGKTIDLPLFLHLPEDYSLKDIKPFVLYHGDLSTPENSSAATFLIKNVAAISPDIKWTFAGMNPSKSLQKLTSLYKNVLLCSNPDEKTMNLLIGQASISILYTNQKTGAKVKLLNALFRGNHCLATPEMLPDASFYQYCHVISHEPEEILIQIKRYINQPVSPEERSERLAQLRLLYDNQKYAALIKNML